MSAQKLTVIDGKGQIPAVGDLKVEGADVSNHRPTAVVSNPHPTAGISGLTDNEAALAIELRVNFDAPNAELVDYAIEAANRAHNLIVQAGLYFTCLKSRCEHGEYEALLAERGVPSQRVSEWCAIAKAVANTPPEHRGMLLKQPRKVLLGIARMDAEVRDRWLQHGDINKRLTMDELRHRVDQLEASERNRSFGAQSEALSKGLPEAGRIVAPDVPLEVTDVRREICALHEKAQLAISSLGDMLGLVQELGAKTATSDWALGTAQMAFTQMQSLLAHTVTQMQGFESKYVLKIELPSAADRAYLRPEEAAIVAEHAKRLKEAHLREVEARDRLNKNKHKDAAGTKGARYKV